MTVFAGSVAGNVAAIAANSNSGLLVLVEVSEFLKIVELQEEPFIVIRPIKSSSFWRTFGYKDNGYLTVYNGISFVCYSKEELRLPKKAVIITSNWAYQGMRNI